MERLFDILFRMKKGIRFFDAHTHVQFAAFEKDYREVVNRALALGVGLVNVGTQKDTSRRAVEIAQEFQSYETQSYETGSRKIGAVRENAPVYAAVGLHPIHTSRSYHDEQELGIISENQRVDQHKSASRGFMSRAEEFDYNYYKKLALDPKVVAIGECGLDYFRLQEDSKKKQAEAFVKQIELAHEVKKPLMIHCRQAFGDLIDILNTQYKILNNPPGIIHFMSGTKNDAKKLLDLGFYFTFGGVITFTRSYDEVIKMIPLDRILSETDAPYVTPVPYRGKRNEPAYVVAVVEKIAEIKGISLEKAAVQILKNTKETLRPLLVI